MGGMDVVKKIESYGSQSGKCSQKVTSRTLHYEKKTTDKNKIQFQICRKLKQAFPSLTTRSAIFPNRIFSAASANNPFTFYCDCQKLPNKIIARINFDK